MKAWNPHSRRKQFQRPACGPVRGATRRRSLARRRAVVAAVLLAALGQVPGTAVAADRVALVVGNSAYLHAGQLPNPGNDANAVGESLERLGFEVTTVLDADVAGMNEALRVFSRASASADVAAVFYAGHGIEVDGVNYLVPVDARLEQDTDVRFETVTLDTVLGATTGAALRLVILDACRNNPLARSMRRSVRTRSASRGSFGELNEDQLAPGLVVAYAAAAGTTADDGEGRHSPYTRALLQYLEAPAEIIQVFRWVQGTVIEATDGRQQPHLYFSLPGERFLNTAGAAAADSSNMPSAAVVNRLEAVVERLNELTDARPASSPAAAPEAPDRRGTDAPVGLASAGGAGGPAAETVFWESIRESTNPAELDAYLARWPNGIYAPLAQTRVAALRPAAAVDPPATADTRQQALRGGRGGEVGLTDDHWLAALPRAARYGRPDRTSESSLDDGSHYEQSSDDRVYRERCAPGAVAGIDVSVRPDTETLHWRWRTSTGDSASVREWRAFINGEWLGEVGDRIVRVADTDVTWYEYEPPRVLTRKEGRFAILFACAGVQELEIHYHH